jgi:multicomponent K+:H+ antiporter subunit C
MSLEFLVASTIAVLVAGGIYLALRGRTFQVVLGLTLLSYAVNLFLFAIGRLIVDRPPLYAKDVVQHADPLPQALVLTAIVITFGMTALTVILSLRSFLESGSDQVDGDPDPVGKDGSSVGRTGRHPRHRCAGHDAGDAPSPGVQPDPVARRLCRDAGRRVRAVRHRAGRCDP